MHEVRVVAGNPKEICVFGGRVMRALLGAGNQNLRPTVELLLVFESRAQAVDEVILPALRKGTSASSTASLTPRWSTRAGEAD